MADTAIATATLARIFGLDAKKLQRHYRNHFSDYQQFKEQHQGKDHLLFPHNLGGELSIDETALSGGELHTIVTSKKATIVSRELQTVIPGVEFNRKALFKNGDTVYAGSINGLYTMQARNILRLIEENQPDIKEAPRARIPVIAALTALLLGALLIVWVRYHRKLRAAESIIEIMQLPVDPPAGTPAQPESLSREKIETFVRNNLPNASIKTIMDEFKISAQQLYGVLKPDRPGSMIQQLRLDTVRLMREQGKSTAEIGVATGLSISYLRKIKTGAVAQG